MAARKKTDVIQLSKIRMREALRAKLARDAEKKGITLNAEIVDRLEDSYGKAARDSAIIDMLVDHNDVSSELLRKIAFELRNNPDWFRSEADMKHMVEGLYFAAYGKEPDEEPRPGEEL